MSGAQIARRPQPHGPEELLHAYRAGASMTELARAWGVSYQRMHYIILNMGEPPRTPADRRPPWNPLPESERAACHPGRRKFRDDLCRSCYQASGSRIQLGDRGTPARIAGTRQRGGPEMPQVCPHCASAPPAWVIEPALGHCVICGYDHYRTHGAIGLPRDANERRTTT